MSNFLSQMILAICMTNAAILLSHGITYAKAQCVEEFGLCVMNRDCCDGLNCVTGDWQYTTDSTCLSKRSEQIDNLNLTFEERLTLVSSFYSRDEIRKVEQTGKDYGKSIADVEKIVNRYRQDFPKLVSRLEEKYGIQLKFDEVRRVKASEL